MKSSTTIAENLGHVRYFEMLKEYYADISAPSLNIPEKFINMWVMKSSCRGHSIKDYKTIIAFNVFLHERSLEKQARKYKDRFGVLPGFKGAFTWER
jgi:adenylate cyclase